MTFSLTFLRTRFRILFSRPFPDVKMLSDEKDSFFCNNNRRINRLLRR